MFKKQLSCQTQAKFRVNISKHAHAHVCVVHSSTGHQSLSHGGVLQSLQLKPGGIIACIV
jgi:hypothetical protein